MHSRSSIYALAALVLCGFAAPLCAQGFDMERDRVPMKPLDGAANAYGQSDDITVLTLTFAGQEVVLA